jgi:class 3 adenylate cyclase/tetratricopeptide (TPR) repeat protein
VVLPSRPKLTPQESKALRRRHVTVMFADLCSSSLLSQSIDPEALAEVMRRVKATAQAVVRTHGGVVNQFYGDGVLAIFGLPAPEEDEVRRATEAALDLHAAVRSLALESYLPPGFAARLHTGIHAGLILVATGDAQTGSYEVLGEPLNTAAALCGAAAEDEIVVSAETLSGAQHFFETEEVGPLRLKGKSSLTHAYRVLRRVPISTRLEARARGGLTPFVGRATELRALERCLSEARAGAVRVAAVVGDAGLGKTRLLEEFLRGLATFDCSVHRGYCESYGGAAPLQPFLQMLRAYFRLDRAMLPEAQARLVEDGLAAIDPRLKGHAPQVLHLLSVRTSASALSEQAMAAALTELFMAWCVARPVVMVIDDWQWADDATRTVLRSIREASPAAPLLVLLGSRKAELGDLAIGDEDEVLQLAPFDVDDTVRAVHALLPDVIDHDLAAKIHRRSGGNPLFLEELCRSPETWRLGDSEGRSVSIVPATLHGLIEARVENLPEAQAEIARTAAVIGRVIPSWLLERVSGHRAQDATVRELGAKDLIHAGDVEGTLRFKHGITRDVVYESVGLHERRALHSRIAEALEKYGTRGSGEELYEDLAYHYAGSADHARAADYAARAGEKAIAAFSLDRARDQLGAALDSLAKLPETEDVKRKWIALTQRWAFASVWRPAVWQLDPIRRSVEYARDLGLVQDEAMSLYWLGFILYAVGEQREAIDAYEQALEVTKGRNDKLTAQLLANLGESLAAACDYRNALSVLDEALALKRGSQSPSRTQVGSGYALGVRAFVLADQGHFASAHEHMRLALAPLEGAGQPVEGSILNLYGIAMMWQGRFSEGAQIAKRAIATAARVRGPYVFAMSSAAEGYARFTVDRDASGLDLLKRASEWMEKQQMHLYLSLPYGFLAEAMAAAERYAEACEYGYRALALAQNGDRAGEAMSCRALARVAAAGGGRGLDSPERYIELAHQSACARESPREQALTWLTDAELKAFAGHRGQAEPLLEQARVAFERMEMRWFVARAELLALAL